MEKPFVLLDTIAGARTGPLAPHVDAYLTLIREQGYSPGHARIQIQVVGRFSQWLQRRRFGIRDMDQSVIERFLHGRRDGSTPRGDTATVYRLLNMLRQAGIARPESQPAPSSSQRLMGDYRRYLLQQRGLSEETTKYYVPFVARFLSEWFPDDRLRLSQLSPPDVTTFVQQHARDFSPGRGKMLVTALRSFLRYLHHQGKIKTDLTVYVPAVAWWSFASVPKFIAASDVCKVLDACSRRTGIGKRNYAILLLLARLGLRAREVADLNLEDLDWDNACITIRGKGARCVQLPLPTDVGEAIALYLRQGRPAARCRRVFIRHQAPYVGFSFSAAISNLVRHAINRAGVRSARTGAHVFRHSLATEMLRQGASLDEIGDLLRHQSPNTTAIYAKVDVSALRPLALSWPGGAR
jgi:site-specific recombinase XerD